LLQVSTQPAAALLTAVTPDTGYVLVRTPVIAMTAAVLVLAAILLAAVCVARIKRSATLQSSEILDGSIKIAMLLDNLQTAIAASDARICALATRLEEHARATQGAASTSYNAAIRLARGGASRQDLMTTCGMTQQEADLVLRLHGADRAARSAA
jgi:hypothetical protein